MNLDMRRQEHLRRFQMLYLRLELFREQVTLLDQQHRALYGQTVRRLNRNAFGGDCGHLLIELGNDQWGESH